MYNGSVIGGNRTSIQTHTKLMSAILIFYSTLFVDIFLNKKQLKYINIGLHNCLGLNYRIMSKGHTNYTNKLDLNYRINH